MQLSNKAQAFVIAKALALGVVSSACSGSSERGGGATNDGTPTVTDTVRESVLCENPDGPEYYRLSVMNAKLRHYPDFAAALGVDSVSDCDGARAFIEALYNYRLANPGFDHDEPMDGPMLPTPARPDDSHGSLEYPKLRNGMEVTNFPVVQISDHLHKTTDPAYKPFEEELCVGTFISKNVILTAAHCITNTAVDLCMKDDVPISQCQPEWFKWGKWDIKFQLPRTPTTPPSSPPPSFTLEDVWAVSDVHPQWLGRAPGDTPDFPNTNFVVEASGPHDLALLYIDDDSRLPYDIESNGAKRISILDPSNGPGDPTIRWPLNFYGWISPTGPDFLTVSASTPSFALDLLAGGGDTIQGFHYSSTTTNPCEGDSGGPLVRQLSLVTNDGTAHANQEAIVGTLSWGETDCNRAPTFDDTDNWARVDGAIDFIEGFMQRWYGPYFSCQTRPDANGAITEMAVAECWGAPCSVDADCGAPELGNYCSNGGPQLTKDLGSCDTCDSTPQKGTCDCVIGQCLWGPKSLPPRPAGGKE